MYVYIYIQLGNISSEILCRSTVVLVSEVLK